MEALIRSHLPGIYRLALAITRDPDQAEDAVQEGLSAAWRHRHQLRTPQGFGPWLQQIVRRAAWRQAKPDPTVVPLEPDLSISDRGAGDLALKSAVAGAMARLSPEHRFVVEQVEVQGLSCIELAEQLGLPAGTIRSRLHYAKKQLQDELRDWL